MTGKQLTAKNAVITTATVEIKALAVNGRQVTQALFRQLREEELIAEDGTLNGVPWGYVNYHPDKCEATKKPESLHRHIVWQLGDDLLRARVPTRLAFDHYAPDFEDPEGEALLAGELIYEWLSRADGWGFGGYPFDEADVEAARRQRFMQESMDFCLVVSRNRQTEITYALLPSEAGVDAARRKLRSKMLGVAWDGAGRIAVNDLQKEILEMRQRCDREHLDNELADQLDAEASRREQWALAHKTLAQLPQLFIAT